VGFFTIKSKNIMPGNSSFWMYSLKHYWWCQNYSLNQWQIHVLLCVGFDICDI
jgi:hypothetical protein